MIDFYGLCANYWGISREHAIIRVVSLYAWSGAALESIHSQRFDRVAQMQPLVMDRIPTEARAEMLSHYGVFVGDN